MLTHEEGNANGHDNGRDTAPDEAFPSLFRAQFDKGSATEEEPEHVGHHIVEDDHHDGHDEPDQTLEHILEWTRQ